MKPEMQQNEATAISWAPQVGKLNAATEPLSATRQGSRLAKGDEIIGTVFFEGPAIIDGKVEGEISGRDKITVGENGTVTGKKLSAASVVIAGTARVDIIASLRIEILPTGRVWGDLVSPALSIQEGAQFEGNASAREFQRTPEDSGSRPRSD